MDWSSPHAERDAARRSDASSRPRRRFIGAGAGVVAAAVVVAVVSHRGSPEVPAAPPLGVTATSAPAIATVTAAPFATSALLAIATPGAAHEQAAIDQLLAGERGVYGVVLVDADGTVRYSRNADTPFVAASLYKLVLLADIYRRIDAGEVDPAQRLDLLPAYFPDPSNSPDGYFGRDAIGTTTTVDEALFATGAYSSNVAAKALLALTNNGALEATAAAIGLHNTHFFVDPQTLTPWPPAPGADSPAGDLDEAVRFAAAETRDGPVNLTTPGDMAIYFERLLQGKVVSGEASFAIFGILGQQAVDDRLPVLLPPDTGLVHKTGNLDHVVHDVGVIYAPDGPMILAAMCEDPPNDAHATEVIQRLALIAYGASEIPPFGAGGGPSVPTVAADA